MSQITLIRHGQANYGARDEAGYDRLSPLGHQQAEWLGEYLRNTGMTQARVYSGTLRRHVETAAGMGHTDPIRDARLNELEYFTLATLLEEQTGLAIPEEREGFIDHLPKVFAHWQAGEIDGAPETYAAFEARISEVLTEIAQGDGPALVVTSGGLIANVMRQALALDIAGMSRMALAIMNSSMHRMFPIGGHLSPVLFNAVPHLETPERQFAQTHV